MIQTSEGIGSSEGWAPSGGQEATMMNVKRWVGGALLPALLACGCEGLSHSENGALAGGAVGAGTGAIVGHALGNTGVGALAGGAIGAVSGALLGKSVDKSEERAAAAAQARMMTLPQIAQMSQQHISEAIIIDQIRSTGSVYHLTSDDILWLKSQGVSDAVVAEMQATATRYPARVYTAVPVYDGDAVYVAPPPPVSVGVGVGFGGGGWR
jgi:hypothetical protein